MAFHNEIGAGRFNRLLQKLFNMKGPPPSRQLGTDVMPTFPFFSGVEHRILESWNEYSLGISVAAVAAQIGFIQFRNPLTSNVLAVIEQIIVSDGVADQWIASITNAAQVDGTVKNVFGLDSRNHGSSSVILSTSTAAAPALSLNIDVFNTIANQAQQLINTNDEQIPVLPGLTLRVQNNTVNTGVNFCIRWRERPLEDSENLAQ